MSGVKLCMGVEDPQSRSLRMLAQPSKRGTDVLPGRWRRLDGCCRETDERDSVMRAGKVLPPPRIGKVKIGDERLV